MSRYSSSLANLGISSAVIDDLERVDSFRSVLDRTGADLRESAFSSPLKELTGFESASTQALTEYGVASSVRDSIKGLTEYPNPGSISESIKAMTGYHRVSDSLSETVKALAGCYRAVDSCSESMKSLTGCYGLSEAMFASMNAIVPEHVSALSGPTGYTSTLMESVNAVAGYRSLLAETTTFAELTKAQSAYRSLLEETTTFAELTKETASYTSMFGMESALTKAAGSYASMFGMESALTKAAGSHASMFGTESTLWKAAGSAAVMFGMDAMAKTQSVYGSLLGSATAFDELRKSQSIFASMFGSESPFAKAQSVYGALFDEHTVTATLGGVRFGVYDSMQESLMRTTDLYRRGLTGGPTNYGFGAADLNRRGVDAYLTSSTNLPTPAALAAGRSGPTAPAKLSLVRETRPEGPDRTVRAGLGVNVAEADNSASSGASSPGSVGTDLALPDHLAIAIVSYCFDNAITMGRLVQELLAGFLNLDPDEPPPPPKKGRHLKLVK